MDALELEFEQRHMIKVAVRKTLHNARLTAWTPMRTKWKISI